MSTQLALRCRCGVMRGTVDGCRPSAVTRVVCYCRDCRAFAHFLEQPDVLDAFGGTEVFQTAQARVRITAGAQNLACLRLSDRGMFRWYAGCCRTPIGNTLRAGIPFVGVIHCILDDDPGRRDEVLGVAVPIQTEQAVGGAPTGAGRIATVRFIARVARNITLWKLRGLAFPSPFFDERTRDPRVVPQVLSAAERELLATRDAR